MFTGASNLAEGVDKAFAFTFIIAFIFIVGISVFMIWTVIHFSRKKGKEAKQFRGSIKLEVLWTTAATILVIIMFWIGWKGFAPMRKVPADAMVVTAIGRMWEWEFIYSDSLRSRELVLPIDKPVKLELVAEDVNHSLFIPAFRVKEDVVPGYDNWLWFTPNYIGNYEILCTEYCGLLHSAMVANTRIVEQDEYDRWYQELITASFVPEPEGLKLLRGTGCLACHSLDGSRLVGPSFAGFYGSQRTVVAGGSTISVTADEAYITKSIYDPNAEIVEGYARNLMQSYRELLTEEQIGIMTEYLKKMVEEEGAQDTGL
ncbi:MAG: cytochrome c oxidase subunit II [Bacteroidales bacterium]|jgi:cytochrome c oxidase subunit 2|nr:cytochrome c oxidase subunit II [Bacteroidales bacterium]